MEKFLVKWTAGNLLRGRYDYIYLNICAMLDFLKGEKWLENTDGVEIHKQVASRLPNWKNWTKKKRMYFTRHQMLAFTLWQKRNILFMRTLQAFVSEQTKICRKLYV